MELLSFSLSGLNLSWELYLFNLSFPFDAICGLPDQSNLFSGVFSSCMLITNTICGSGLGYLFLFQSLKGFHMINSLRKKSGIYVFYSSSCLKHSRLIYPIKAIKPLKRMLLLRRNVSLSEITPDLR